MHSLSYAGDLQQTLPDLATAVEGSRERRWPHVKEVLPFTVRLVRSEEDMLKAVRIRYEAYSRHVPEFAKSLKAPEPLDWQSGSAVLLAESKLDGMPLGSMRIQTNEFAPLSIEQAVTLPSWLENRSLAGANRLSVVNHNAGRLVKAVLFKAFYQYCVINGVDWMVIAARPPIDRMYKDLLFSDVFPEQGCIPLKHAAGIPHRIMSFNVQTAERTWVKASHPQTAFMVYTTHPDIKLEESHVGVLQ